MIVSPSFSEVAIHTAVPFIPLYSLQALCSQAFMQKHLISIQASGASSSRVLATNACAHSALRREAPLIISVDIGGVFKCCVL